MSTNTQNNPVWEAILKYGGANAINVANAYYSKVTRDVGDSLDKLRQATAAAITTGVKVAFSIASAILIQSIIEAGSQLASAYASLSAINEMSAGEKGLQKAQEKTQGLEKDEKEIKDNITKEKDPTEKANLQNKLKGITSQKEASKKVVDKKNKKASDSVQKAGTKAQMINAAAQGAAAMPKAYQDAEQTKGRAIQEVLNQLISMLSSTYDKSNQTLRGFLDFDYLSALVSLGQVQLR